MARSFIFLAAITTAVALQAAGTRATAQSPSKDAIIEQLDRHVKTRSIDIEELRKSVKNLIDDNSPTNKTAPSLPNLANELPSIGLSIYFDYNSAVIKPESMPTLVQLGQALIDQRLAAFRFLIAGHTDAAGSREYNRHLSEQRADAVRTFLVASFRLPPDHLPTIGYGMEQLKDAANPLSGVNRRVEIVNIGQ